MIGQQTLISQLTRTQARSVLITGPAHWGKKTLLREFFRKEESVYEITGNANAFREAVDRIYQTVRPTVYLIPDIDKANLTIQNLLLKVLEEPPLSARFFLTASGAILQTITSRCVTFHLEPYKDTHAELGGIATDPAVLGMFRSPGEAQLINLPNISTVTTLMQQIKTLLDQKSSLALVLKQGKELNKAIAATGLTQEGYILLSQHIFGETYATDWLRQQPDDSVKYARMAYLMKLWVERQLV